MLRICTCLHLSSSHVHCIEQSRFQVSVHGRDGPLFITSLSAKLLGVVGHLLCSVCASVCTYRPQAMIKRSVQGAPDKCQKAASYNAACLLLRQAALIVFSRGSHTAHPARCLMTSKQCASVCVVLQVAAEPDLAPLLSELVDNSDGQEIYLRRPERYGLASSTPTTFAHVSLPSFPRSMAAAEMLFGMR